VTPAQRRLASKAAAIGLLAVVIGLPLTLVIAPVIGGWIEEGRANAATLDLIARYRQLAANRADWEARIKSLEAEGAGNAGLIAVSPAPAATAALQSDIRQIVQAHGGDLRTTQPQAATPENGLERIEAGFELSLPAAQLPGFLEALDRHDPYLFADRMELTTTETPNRAQTLSIHLQIHAYRRPA